MKALALTERVVNRTRLLIGAVNVWGFLTLAAIIALGAGYFQCAHPPASPPSQIEMPRIDIFRGPVFAFFLALYVLIKGLYPFLFTDEELNRRLVELCRP